MKNSVTKKICMCGLFAALTAVFSQIQIPMASVPINLATFSVMLSGSILGWKYGAVSQIVYVLLGMVGAPVFAGFTGGLGVVAGKTGGYIIGYIACAFIVGLMTEKIKIARKIILPISMVIGTIACYILGTTWFMILTNTGLWQSLVWCVIPFLIGGAIKIAVASAITGRLKKAVKLS